MLLHPWALLQFMKAKGKGNLLDAKCPQIPDLSLPATEECSNY